MLNKLADGVLGLFWDKKPATKVTPETVAALQTPAPINGNSNIFVPVVVTGVPDENFLNVLADALAGANTPGYDYLEYRQAVQKMVTKIPDECSRYNLVFDSVANLGVTHDTLIDSAQYYLDVLKKEEEQFSQAQTTRADIEMKRIFASGKPLQNTIEELVTWRTTLTSQRQGFDAALAVLRSQIQSDMNKIDQYLATPVPITEGITK